MSSTNLNTDEQCRTPKGYDFRPVADRPVFHPDLAAFFTGLRVARGLGFRQALDIAKRQKLPALTAGTLWGLEKGKTKNPKPEVLRDLAKLYGLSYETVARPIIDSKWALDRDKTANDNSDAVGTSVPTTAKTKGKRADQILRNEEAVDPLGSPYASTSVLALLASTRSALERIMLDLATVAEQLPGRQAPVDRHPTATDDARHRRPGRSGDRARKKAPGARPSQKN